MCLVRIAQSKARVVWDGVWVPSCLSVMMDLVVGNKFLRQVKDRPEEYRAAMSVLQGSLPTLLSNVIGCAE